MLEFGRRLETMLSLRVGGGAGEGAGFDEEAGLEETKRKLIRERVGSRRELVRIKMICKRLSYIIF